MRNMPVGSGRRKNKNPTSHCQFVTISQDSFQTNVPSKLLSFGSDSPDVDYRNRENGDDCSSGSTVTTSNSVVEKIPDTNGFHSHVPCIPEVSWSYNPWNSAVPIPAIYPVGYSPMSFYPSPYWNYIPWLPQSDSILLGKHSREGESKIPDGSEESKLQRSSVLIPKTLRIDDPDEAAKSSIWSTLGIKNENIRTGGVFKAFQTKGEDNKKHPANTTSPILQVNPAALSRSLYFQERA